jgi:hypothetical protein
MSSNTCIYRKTNCLKCKLKTTNNNEYCEIHTKYANVLFNILDKFLDNKKIISNDDIYSLFIFIYSREENDNKKQFHNIIDYLYINKYKLFSILDKYDNKYFLLKYKKHQIIEYIHDLFYNTYKISEDNAKVFLIKKLQKRVKKYLMYKLNVYYENETSVNDADPFTCDPISEIPYNIKFSFKDKLGHLYTFNSIELDYFIKKVGAWNPYTKELLSEDLIYKLKLFNIYNKNTLKSIDDKYNWKTPLQAYTDVSQIIEKIGFYNNVEWFMKLTYINIKNIIRNFHYTTVNIPNSKKYFKETISIQTYVYDFSKNIIKLFENGNDHYLLCCKFIKSLGLFSPDFYNNMPSWLVNIDETLSYDTSNIRRENMIIYPINISNNRNDMINNIMNNIMNQNDETIPIDANNNDLINIVRYFDIIFNVFDETE